MITLYKRNAQGRPLIWSIDKVIQDITRTEVLFIKYGLVGGTLHEERVVITKSKVDELESRVKAKRKEGYKELTELKDNINISWAESTEIQAFVNNSFIAKEDLIKFLNTYLPKYSTTSEGFILPMLAKVLEDNKPFEKYGTMLGQWKIDGLRCIIGAETDVNDIFRPIILTYHSRTGEDWTAKMSWMDDIILPKISKELLDMMIEEGACLDGELYLPGYNVNDVNSFVKNTQLPQHYKLQYWCYDICCENMSASVRDNNRQKLIDIQYLDVTRKETHLNNKDQFVILPTTYGIENINDALFLRDKFIEYGFEGLILRNPIAEYQFGKRNQAMFKFKKVDDGRFIIVDIKSEHKRNDLPLFVLRNDINDELFECSINKPQDEQRGILINKEKYVGKYMFVEYRSRSGIAQVPFHARGVNIEN